MDKEIEIEVEPWSNLALYAIFFLVAFIVWAFWAELDEVAVSQAEVVPEGQVRAVQHLEGGIVVSLLRKEGDRVSKGDELGRIELGRRDSNLAQIEMQKEALKIKRARLNAEATGGIFEIIQDATSPLEIQRSELANYKSRKIQLDGIITISKSQIEQKETDIVEIRTRLEGLEDKLAKSIEKKNIFKQLFNERLVTKIELIDAENEVANLQNKIKEEEVILIAGRQSLAETKERSKGEVLRFRREAAEELAKVELALSELEEKLIPALAQEKRSKVESPIDGIIKKRYFNTIGGVVQPGDVLYEIVPVNDQLVIEVKLDPVNVGYVRLGQLAVVKIETYDFIRYGTIEGYVDKIAADTSLDRNGMPFYPVIIRTKKNYVGDVENKLMITPGMRATVDIHTGKKTIMEYLVSPVLKKQKNSFRER
ncbi:MAG: HlyD family type I secretion periplasmic adaptor subunit [Alphaproteobacteria bacterium]